MMVDSGADAASRAAPREAAEYSPTKLGSSEEEDAPAAKAPPPDAAPSGHRAAEPPSVDRAPDVQDTP
eukprot:4250478-Pyramimonas_sp.AAC.1